jgi:hypothetical protein
VREPKPYGTLKVEHAESVPAQDEPSRPETAAPAQLDAEKSPEKPIDDPDVASAKDRGTAAAMRASGRHREWEIRDYLYRRENYRMDRLKEQWAREDRAKTARSQPSAEEPGTAMSANTSSRGAWKDKPYRENQAAAVKEQKERERAAEVEKERQEQAREEHEQGA